MPPSRWHLSDDGRESCGRLAAALRPFRPAALFTSPQPKAAETAALVSGELGTAPVARDGLREHDESGAPFFGSDTEFATAVAEFFARPDECVYGAESARDALARFDAELRDLAQITHDPLAIVSHGRVISLYVAAQTGVEAFGLWQRLTLPSFVVLDPARGRIEHIATGF